MSTDTLDREYLSAAAHAFIDSLDVRAFGRNEAFLVTPEDTRRMHRDDLAAELRDNGMRTLARKVERTIVPTDHVLVLYVDVEAKLQLVRVFGADV